MDLGTISRLSHWIGRHGVALSLLVLLALMAAAALGLAAALDPDPAGVAPVRWIWRA